MTFIDFLIGSVLFILAATVIMAIITGFSCFVACVVWLLRKLYLPAEKAGISNSPQNHHILIGAQNDASDENQY